MAKKTLDKKTLVVIEAPGKEGAFSKILGKNATVMATSGHIRDLPPKKFGVDLKNNYEMTYQYYPEKKELCKAIKDQAKKAEQIFIATDSDREGESIGFAVYDLFSEADKKKVKRLKTNAIKEKEIWAAVNNLTELNEQVFEAYEARRVLDRLVGYKASYPIKQATGGPSAGRCQSPGLRIIVEREKEIQAFVPQVYWPVEAVLEANGKEKFAASIKKPKPLDISTKEEAEDIIDNFKNNDIYVTKHTVTNKKMKAQPPFVTSSLQRAASTYLGFGPKKTMSVAQALYQKHHVITYHRTDAPFIVPDVVSEIRDHISSNYGKNYLPATAMKYASKGGSQEAHEACRPTEISLQNFHGGSSDERKLYRLIWERTIASQMKPAEVEGITAEFSTKKKKNNILSASGRRVLFDGYQKAWSFGGTTDQLLPEMKEGDKVDLDSIKTEKKETKPPPRYSEASLLKSLEDKGIGRPATYASIVETIKDRDYAKLENKALHATELGIRVCDFMTDDVGFSFIDYTFTSDMESSLDKITEGKECKLNVINKAWEALQKDIEKAKQVKVDKEKTDFPCPKCKANLLLKTSKYGPFFTCEKYNSKIETEKCDYKADVGEDGKPKEKVKKEIVYSEHKCPKCEAPMVLRKGRYGDFHGCSEYFKTKCGGMRDAEGKVIEQKKKSYKKKWSKKKKKKSK